MRKAPNLKTPKHRSLQEVNREYSQVCMQVGDLRHKLVQIPRDLESLEQRLFQLDKEAVVVRELEEKEAPKPASVAQ